MRLFIAVGLPELHKREILRDTADFADVPSVRVVKPRQMHLTLCFLGERREEEIPDIASVVEDACQTFPGFQVSYEGVSAFPDTNRPRVLVVPVFEGVEKLRELEYFLCSRLTSSDTKKRFVPHITIGRVGRNYPQLRRLLKEPRWQGTPRGSFGVETIALYQSVLQPSGAQYTICSERTLRK